MTVTEATEAAAAAPRRMGRRRALLLLALANAFWGTAWPVAKVATAELAPPLLAALRITLAAGLFWAVSLWGASRARPASRPPAGRGVALRAAALGVVGLGVSYPLIYAGIGRTTASDGSLMIIGEVIFTTLLAAWLAREPLDRRRVGGALLGSAGVVALVVGGAASGEAGGAARATGDLLILGGLLLQALVSVVGADLSRRAGPLSAATWIYTGSLVVWLPLIAWYALRGELGWPSPAALAAIVYLAAIPSVGCNLIWYAVLRQHGASVGAISLFVQPLVGALLGVLALGEPLTLALVGGGALIFLALALLVLEPRRPHIST